MLSDLKFRDSRCCFLEYHHAVRALRCAVAFAVSATEKLQPVLGS